MTGGGTRYATVVVPAEPIHPARDVVAARGARQPGRHRARLRRLRGRRPGPGGSVESPRSVAARDCGHSVRRRRRGRHRGSPRRSRPHPSRRQPRDVAGAGEDLPRVDGRSRAGIRAASIRTGPLLFHQQQQRGRFRRMDSAQPVRAACAGARSDARHGADRADAAIRRRPAKSASTCPAGESLLLSGRAIAAGEPASATTVAGAPIPIDGPWTLSFVAGGPTLPATADARPARLVDHARRRCGQGVFGDRDVFGARAAAERSRRRVASRSRARPRQRPAFDSTDRISRR